MANIRRLSKLLNIIENVNMDNVNDSFIDLTCNETEFNISGLTFVKNVPVYFSNDGLNYFYVYAFEKFFDISYSQAWDIFFNDILRSDIAIEFKKAEIEKIINEEKNRIL